MDFRIRQKKNLGFAHLESCSIHFGVIFFIYLWGDSYIFHMVVVMMIKKHNMAKPHVGGVSKVLGTSTSPLSPHFHLAMEEDRAGLTVVCLGYTSTCHWQTHINTYQS